MSNASISGDGSFDLILVKRSRRTDFLRFFYRAANDGQTIGELSNVERYRATEVNICPIATRRSGAGNWACDGEPFTANKVTIRAHHQALNLFASGIRLSQIKEINEDESLFQTYQRHASTILSCIGVFVAILFFPSHYSSSVSC